MAVARRHHHLAARAVRRRHVVDHRDAVPARPAKGDGISAKHPPLAPGHRHIGGRGGHGVADQPGVADRLNLGPERREMEHVADRQCAHPVFPGDLDQLRQPDIMRGRRIALITIHLQHDARPFGDFWRRPTVRLARRQRGDQRGHPEKTMRFGAVPLRPPDGAGQGVGVGVIAANLQKGGARHSVNFIKGKPDLRHRNSPVTFGQARRVGARVNP